MTLNFILVGKKYIKDEVALSTPLALKGYETVPRTSFRLFEHNTRLILLLSKPLLHIAWENSIFTLALWICRTLKGGEMLPSISLLFRILEVVHMGLLVASHLLVSKLLQHQLL